MDSDTKNIYREFLRKYICCYEGEDMHNITQWCLFNYHEISYLLKEGKIKYHNKTVNKQKTTWFYPSTEIINKIIYPAYVKIKQETKKNNKNSKLITNYEKYI